MARVPDDEARTETDQGDAGSVVAVMDRGARFVAPSSNAEWLSFFASLFTCVGVPVVMVIANKSAPVLLGCGALLAHLSMVANGQFSRILPRFRSTWWTGTGLALTALAVLAAASWTWSIAPSLTRRGLIEGAPEFIFGWGLAVAWPLVVRRTDLIWLLPVGLIAAALLIDLEAALGLPLHIAIGARAYWYDLKRSAIPLVLLLWPAMAFAGRALPIWVSTVTALIVLSAAIAAHSSASIVAIVVSALAFCATGALPNAMPVVVGCGALALLVAAPWTGTLVAHLLPPHLADLLSQQHAAQRIEIWQAFEHHIRDKHLFGHGFLTSFKISQEVTDPDAVAARAEIVIDRIHPHNVLLQLWIEFGVLGATLASAAISYVVARLRHLPPPRRATRIAFIVSAGVVSLVGLNAWAAWWMAVIAVCLTLFTIDRDEASRPTLL